MANSQNIIKYGTHFETKEEAISRVCNKLRYTSEPLKFRVYYNHKPEDLQIIDGKLCFRGHGHEYIGFKIAFTGDNWEADDVIDVVETRIIKDLEDYRIAEEARKKKEKEDAIARDNAEREARAARKDAERKAKYASWKAEAERLGIPFADLCAMKRAEMEEAMYDDDDWD